MSEPDLETLQGLVAQLAFDRGVDIAQQAVAWVYIGFCRSYRVTSPFALETLQARLRTGNPVDPMAVALRVANARNDVEMNAALAMLLISKAAATSDELEWRSGMLATAAYHLDAALATVDVGEQFLDRAARYLNDLLLVPDAEGKGITLEMVDSVLESLHERSTN